MPTPPNFFQHCCQLKDGYVPVEEDERLLERLNREYDHQTARNVPYVWIDSSRRDILKTVESLEDGQAYELQCYNYMKVDNLSDAEL